MEKRIDLERRGRKPENIPELNLDNCRTTLIEGLTSDFTSLEVLSMINCGLTSLKGFPSLPELRKLELSDNRLSNSLEYLSGCPKLEILGLSGNKFKAIESLEPLKDFSSLQNLDLYNCDVVSSDENREKIFELIPSLKVLDGLTVSGEEAENDEDFDGIDRDEIENGFDDDEDSFTPDEEDDEPDASSDGQPGLEYLYNKDNPHEDEEEDDEEDADFEGGENDDDDSSVQLIEEADNQEEDGDEEEDEAEEEETSRFDEEDEESSSHQGLKRKHDDEDDDDETND